MVVLFFVRISKVVRVFLIGNKGLLGCKYRCYTSNIEKNVKISCSEMDFMLW